MAFDEEVSQRREGRPAGGGAAASFGLLVHGSVMVDTVMFLGGWFQLLVVVVPCSVGLLQFQ